MSDTKSDIMKIWRECFPADSPEWVEMYFNREYSPECALTSVDDRGNTVSSLMLQPYSMTFHGQEAGVSYVSGAATMPRHRNQGHMTQLIRQAILASHSRGDMLCALIPANDMLRQYYARSGFASVFFSRLHRYTSAHIFSSHSNYTPVAADNQTALYDAYRNLAHLRPCAIIHTPHQFGTIMIDNAMSGGAFEAVADNNSGHIAALAWAIPQNDSASVKITDILARDDDARRAVLQRIRMRYPDRPLIIMDTPPDNSSVALTQQGMARVTRAGMALEIIARNYPNLKSTIRITDPIIADNNATFLLNGDGTVGRLPHDNPGVGQIDLDITIEILCRLIFSPSSVGAVTGIPSVRPVMTLMLD